MRVELTSSRSIQEFWIDFLLEEEFAANPHFATAFAKACGLADEAWLVDKVVHSCNDAFGEADLIVILTAGKRRTGLLIENKINATFQHQQAERYFARGESGKAQGFWGDFKTVLVAPERYLTREHAFQSALALEAIVEWVCPNDPERRAFKIARIGRAIDKKNTTGVQIVDEPMTVFRKWYGALIAARGCGFAPPAERLAYSGDNWMEWTSERLPTACRFRHRTRTGAFDLSFVGMAPDSLEYLRASIPDGFAFGAIGTKLRAAILMSTDSIVDVTDLATAEPIVRRVLDAAERLQDFVVQRMEWPA